MQVVDDPRPLAVDRTLLLRERLLDHPDPTPQQSKVIDLDWTTIVSLDLHVTKPDQQLTDARKVLLLRGPPPSWCVSTRFWKPAPNRSRTSGRSGPQSPSNAKNPNTDSVESTATRNCMSRRGRGSRTTSTRSVPDLEEILRAGDAVLYGQVCWSMANRATNRSAAGDVITLEGTGEAGERTTRAFCLTRESVENVERCIGMRTCEEAVALFAARTEGEPWGECPLGHREAALEYMMHGTEPSEPCPECGEIPKFCDPAMSPNFYSDVPVKGVDGKEHRACPRCGEDALELQGTNPVRWGWQIVCPSCDWEIKQAERLDIGQYCELMEEVKSRIISINQLMEMPGITIRTRIESVSLQLRMLLELVVFSSLVSNKDVWQRSLRELRSSQDMGNKLKELKRIHPNFFPRPIDQEEHMSEDEPAERLDGFLTEDELQKVYGRLGNVLHAKNPMGTQTDYRYFMDAVPEWISKVQNLLECHKVYLYHHPEEFYLIKMVGDVDGQLLCIPFKMTADGKPKCAWPDCVSSTARLYCEYIRRPWRECGLPEIEPAQAHAKRAADGVDSLYDA